MITWRFILICAALAAPSFLSAAPSPLTLTIRDASGRTCIFTPNDAGLSMSHRPGIDVEGTGDLDCSGGGGAVSSMVIAGPTSWTITLPWRVGQPRSVQWFAYPALSCSISAIPLSGQAEMILSGATTCSGVGTQQGQPPVAACVNVKQLVMLPQASGAYVLGVDCQNGSYTRNDSRIVVVSPPA